MVERAKNVAKNKLQRFLIQFVAKPAGDQPGEIPTPA
jgi:hypothetical protein